MSSVLCKGLNSSDQLVGGQHTANSILSDSESHHRGLENIDELILRDCQLKCIKPVHLSRLTRLTRLVVSDCGLKKLLCSKPVGQEQTGVLNRLVHLDVSRNQLIQLEQTVLDQLDHLKYLNLSHNQLRNLHPFTRLTRLQQLDLSGNRLDEFLQPRVFQTLPPSVQFLDISRNSWVCSSRLAWMYDWRQSLADGIIRKVNETRCRHQDDTKHRSPLFLIMEFYAKHVVPYCPTNDNCTCLLHNIQEKVVTSSKRHYTVHVACRGQGLTHFPKLPQHTQTVDLTHNLLNNSAFDILDVKKYNYHEVDSLTLDNNRLESLSEKLLEMNLGLRFSAKNNTLTDISYDVSQELIRKTAVILLANNPWKCTCSSQITDIHLISKIEDRELLKCGPGSDVLLEQQQISTLEPEMICPPKSQGVSQELMLQLLCLLLAILIVLVLAKLAYDFQVYRTRGHLPWVALKMPSLS